MRKYQPIWEALKLHLTVTIKIAPDLHLRTIQCVRKEKHGDSAFKFITAEVGNSYKLFHTIAPDGEHITFTLQPEKSKRNL